ncbi:GntR family transcriptional regulator [Pollutimonas harenae]|uniref:GntR family transcriptional regulator n=1 Tax=Pollutimonas harenae TaxID=657015 RepID=A0A853GTD1_9BURK|nr:GntR family transcriptional regulator [Pollutimonas harenae]NYT86408.1 GntR family transcriptional regulator [Pollutimonas harenae]TEA69839.1 GntR family transcriptional regulator [Pollutimonas harenae]
MGTRIVQQVLYLEVADRLRAMIASRELEAGAWIDEVNLTQELGISRTPLREALKVLVAEGLLRLEPRRGCFVNELSARDLDDIFPLMAMLEGRCAHEAARKVTDDDLQRLEPLHQELQWRAKAGDIDQYYATNALIHEAIQALADNRWLSDLVDNLRKLLSLSRHKSLAYPGRVQESCAEHLAIFAALKARDSDGAEALTRKHLMRQLNALHALAAQDSGALTVDPLSSSALHDSGV